MQGHHVDIVVVVIVCKPVVNKVVIFESDIDKEWAQWQLLDDDMKLIVWPYVLP